MVFADGLKICELAAAKHGTKYGAVTALAASIGCAPKSISNMRGGRWIGAVFAGQIAEALGVDVGVFTLPDDEDEDEQPEPAEQSHSEAA